MAVIGALPEAPCEFTTPAVLDRLAVELADRVALITDNRVLSFRELRAEARRVAASLMTLGVGPGDRVAIWSPNSWHWVIACLATHYAGGVLVPLNVGFTTGEACDILARSRVGVLFAADALADRLTSETHAALPELRHVVQMPVDPADPDSADPDWAGRLADPAVSTAELDARAAAVRADDVADILFTSGTTGRSKGVVCAHRQSLSASASAAASRAMTSADRFLCGAPLFHSYGYKHGLLAALQVGAALVSLRSADPELVMRVVAEHRVTRLSGPPTLFAMLLDHPARNRYDLSSLRMATTGAATVPVALIERIQRELGADAVLTAYGLTEGSGFGTACRPGDDAITVATTCGRPIADFELAIADPDEQGVGEVLLRGPNVMLGYLDDPVATAAAIDVEGWLHTGDVGSVDAAGNLRITDRFTDMYICSGSNVYPAEVEQVLARLEGVADAAVIGVADELRGEVGRAFVVLRPDAQLDERAVLAHARRHLAHYKTPRSVLFVDELPRNAGGKVLKTALRALHIQPARIKPPGAGGPPMGAVENWVADAWQALLDIERPGRRDEFVDLGGDSVAAVAFAGKLETQFGMSMSLDRLAECPTIAAVVAALEPGSGQPGRPVVTLRSDGAGPVCLLVPGIGGHAWTFLPLARSLTGPCDVWGLSLMDLRDGPAGGLRDRIRAAALAALAPAVAEGRRILVGGYSFGGVVAADLADWLDECGVTVSGLLLLDPDPVDSDFQPRHARHFQRGPRVLIMTPGSPAARKLNDDITAMAGLVQDAYVGAGVRLPQTEVWWLQTPQTADRHYPVRTLFGAPVDQANIAKTVVELSHLGLIEIPGVDEVARWMDRHLAGQPGLTARAQ